MTSSGVNGLPSHQGVINATKSSGFTVTTVETPECGVNVIESGIAVSAHL